MKRVERMTITMRPEVKEVVKELFQESSVADAFEWLVKDYLNSTIESYKEELKDNNIALESLERSGEDFPTLIPRLHHTIAIQRKKIIKLEEMKARITETE